MSDGYVEEITIESVIFRVSQEYGALVVYVDVPPLFDHWDVEVWTPGRSSDYGIGDKKIATVPAIGKLVNGEKVEVAVFPRLIPATYLVQGATKYKQITIFPGWISELDLRSRRK